MTHPAVQLADVALLGGHAPMDGPRLRLYVTQDRRLRLSPLMGLDDPRSTPPGTQELEPASEELGPGSDNLALSGPGITAARELPWLGRYHAALHAVQAARARGHEDAQVSGFGVRFDTGLPLGPDAPDLRDPLAPVLLRSGDTFLMHVPATGTDFRVDAETVRALERAMVTPEAAAERALRLVARFAEPTERAGAGL
ncbi:hypothetical protein [Streptomyces sp. NPDC058473]